MDFFPFGIEILFLETETERGRPQKCIFAGIIRKNRAALPESCQALLPSENFSLKGRGGVEMAWSMITDVDHHKNINKNLNFQTRDFQWNLTISNKFLKKYIMKPFTVMFWPNRVGVSKQPARCIWRFKFLFYWIINNLDTRQDSVGGHHFSLFLLPKIWTLNICWVGSDLISKQFTVFVFSRDSPHSKLFDQSRPGQARDLYFSFFVCPDLEQNMMDWRTIK